ncbi:S9 family peptidase, partial [bacterium]
MMPSRNVRAGAALALLASAGVGALAQGPSSVERPDPYVWLEDVWGKRSLQWIAAENARTARVLESDPRFARLQAEALRVAESPDRLPRPEFRNGAVYNFWQDRRHPQGILRRTSLADYRRAKPHWKTVLDYDALGKKDRQKWVASGLTGLFPGDRRVLVNLSAGGEDAIAAREFDLKTGAFVKGGFVLPRSKQNVDWLDEDALLVARDWGKGTMTASGYPFVVRLVRRGAPLKRAREIFRGTARDTWVYPVVLNDAQGNRLPLISRGLDFFRSAAYVWNGRKAVRLAVPEKCELNGLLEGRLIVTLKQDWNPTGRSLLRAGSVVALDARAVRRDPARLRPTLVFAPTAREFAQQVALTRSRLVLTTLENVQGRAYVFRPSPKGAWARTRIPLPDNRTVGVASANRSDDRFFLTVTGFTTPPTAMLGDASRGSLVAVRSQKPLFDASRLVVEQLAATSSDGTRVPYFVVRRKDLPRDGGAPTLMEAYGGFEISITPEYSGTLGKLWLERGGVYVVPSIR